VREKAKKVAAHLLEVGEADVEWQDYKFQVKGVPAKSVTMKEVAFAAYTNMSQNEPGLEASYYYDPPNMTFPSGCYVAVVDVARDAGLGDGKGDQAEPSPSDWRERGRREPERRQPCGVRQRGHRRAVAARRPTSRHADHARQGVARHPSGGSEDGTGVNLQYSGEEKIAVGPGVVWAFVTDPGKVGRCMPEVKEVAVQDQTH